MTIEWRKAPNWRWPEDKDAFVGGKIRVGSLRRPIGAKSESPKIRAHTFLPQTSLESGKTFEASEINLVKGLVENAIKSWFKGQASYARAVCPRGSIRESQLTRGER